MRDLRRLLSLVLAVALVVGTMSVALASGAVPQIVKATHSMAAESLAAGVSSVSVTPKTATVKVGEKQKFAATALGVSGVEAVTVPNANISWTVEGTTNTSTTIKAGELSVAANETAKLLTVVATWTDSGAATATTGTATVTVTGATLLHMHSAECMKVRVAYNLSYYADGQDFVHMDTTEATPKSTYFQVRLTCKESASLNPAQFPVNVAVVGEFKDILSATKPTPYNMTTNGAATGDASYASRLALNPGKTIQGAKAVELEVTVGDAKVKAEVDLYAEAKDPVYASGTAVFSVDLKDLQSSYTSSVAAVTVPGGVRTIAAVEIADEYMAKDYEVKLVDGGIQLVTKTQEGSGIYLSNNVVRVRVTFKARTAPLALDIPIEINSTNSDLFTLNYTQKLNIPKANEDRTSVDVVVDESLAGVEAEASVDKIEVKPGKNGVTIARSQYNSSEGKLYLVGSREGSTTFDAILSVSASGTAKDGTSVNIYDAQIQKTNNPITVSGSIERKGVHSGYTSQIDINKPESYKIDVMLTPDLKGDKVTVVTVGETLEGDNQLEGAVRDYFTIGDPKMKEDGSYILTLILKNDASVTLDSGTVAIPVKVTLASMPQSTIEIGINLEFVADAPVVTAYTYGTSTAVSESSMAVGESKKFDIKTTRSDAVHKMEVYAYPDALTLVRGNQFHGDRADTETITLNLRKAFTENEGDGRVRTDFKYTPNIINEAVKLKISGIWQMYGHLLTINNGSGSGGDNGDDDNNDGDNDNNGTGGNTGGGTAGGGSSSNNTANTPATSDKVTETANALKDIANVGNLTADKLPTGVTLTTTAGGSSIATIPVALVSGAAGLRPELLNTLGAASSKVGLEITVSSGGINAESVKIIIPGGFGAIQEAGRLSFPMDFKPKADDSERMLALVKGTTAVSSTAQVGGNFTLPVAATVSVKSTAPNGSTVNIYKFDPLTGRTILIGSAKVVNGTLTFATKMMGQMLFTTGKI